MAIVVIRNPEIAKKTVTPLAPFQKSVAATWCGSAFASTDWLAPMWMLIWCTTTAIIETPRSTSIPSKRPLDPEFTL
jgi:hypothetical protein